ncbi:hypothetical protein [Thomasclavelia sp.]|uniref:hypothetical protein n=1 Tax=Thomasclavelia sp. TaxID=3025757 RepID=UPI0025F1DD62|nr:hypothetical protein [Thomasclavelia sp.]
MKNKFLEKAAPYLATFKTDLSDTKFDYFIRFKETNLINKVSCHDLKEIGDWQKYGETSYRGWSKLSKEAITKYIIEHFTITQEQFEVINANNDLFRIRF